MPKHHPDTHAQCRERDLLPPECGMAKPPQSREVPSTGHGPSRWHVPGKTSHAAWVWCQPVQLLLDRETLSTTSPFAV